MTACTILQTAPYPIYEIDLVDLDTAADISKIVKNFNTTRYVYTFEYNGEIIISESIDRYDIIKDYLK